MASSLQATDSRALLALNITNKKDPDASLAGRNVSSNPEVNPDLQEQVNKLNELVTEMIPFLVNRILNLEKTIVDLKKEMDKRDRNYNLTFDRLVNDLYQ